MKIYSFLFLKNQVAVYWRPDDVTPVEKKYYLTRKIKVLCSFYGFGCRVEAWMSPS